MSLKVQLSVAMAALLILPALAKEPAFAQSTAKAKTKSSAKTSQWPRWYYYDQVGLRAWNAREKDKAERYFKMALDTCQADIGGKKNLDPVTKRMVGEVINHQFFLVSNFKVPDKQTLNRVTPKEGMALTKVYQIEETPQKIKDLDRLAAFHERIFGKNDERIHGIRRTQAKLRIRKITLKKEVEGLRGWPPNSYDNGGRYAVTTFYHINPDGTTTEIDKPTEDSMRSHDPTYKRNEWYKKNYKDPNRTGSHYRGLRPSMDGHMPDWYADQNGKVVKKRDDNSKTMYVGKRKIEPNPGHIGTGYDPNKPKPVARSQHWGDNPRNYNDPDSTGQRRTWGAPQPYKTTTFTGGSKRNNEKNIPWGAYQKPKKEPDKATAEDRMKINPKARELMKRFTGKVNVQSDQ